MIYLDTSVLGALFFREPTASAVARALRARASEGLAISAWTLTEMASVGAIKERTLAISATARREASLAFHRFAAAELGLVEVESSDFRAAASMVERVAGVRAGDALHLAVANRTGASLASLDKRLVHAAPACGVSVVRLLD